MQNGRTFGKEYIFKSSRYRCSRNSRQTRSIRSRHARANVSPRPRAFQAYSIFTLRREISEDAARRGAALSRERRSSDFAEVPLRWCRVASHCIFPELLTSGS